MLLLQMFLCVPRAFGLNIIKFSCLYVSTHLPCVRKNLPNSISVSFLAFSILLRPFSLLHMLPCPVCVEFFGPSTDSRLFCLVTVNGSSSRVMLSDPSNIRAPSPSLDAHLSTVISPSSAIDHFPRSPSFTWSSNVTFDVPDCDFPCSVLCRFFEEKEE